MNAISKIIFDTLSAGQGINLPEIGSLYVERDAARFISKTEIKPPHNRVLFSHKQNESFKSVVDIIATAGGKDQKSAAQDYADWLEKTKNNRGLLEINEVGVLKNDFFYPSAALHDTLNPGGQKTVKLKQGSGAGKKVLIVFLILLAIAVILFFVVALDRYLGTRKEAKLVAEQTELVCPAEDIIKAEKIKEPKVKEEKVKEPKVKEPKPEKKVVKEDESKISEDIAELKKDAVAIVDDVKDEVKEEAVGCWQKFLNLFRKKDNKADIVTVTVIEVPAEPTHSTKPDVNCKPDVPAEPKHNTKPAVSCEPVYHVVAGVFSHPSNADKFIAQDNLKIGRNGYHKMPYKNNMTMVVVYSSNNREDATRRMKQLRRYENELWVYTQQ